ncbi:MAG: HAMP domain-containing histidine kinase [Oscillospiraceae bacterium]|nr:HAMP domain-containing histidine kinase [Oscillospiraceae bacterium]
MKAFDRILILILFLIAAVFIAANLCLSERNNSPEGRPYRVEIGRIALEIEQRGLENIDLTRTKYVTAVEKIDLQNNASFETNSDYIIREINGELYRFDYRTDIKSSSSGQIIFVNLFLAIMSVMTISVMLFIRFRLLVPFQKMTDLPYELSKGNLAVPVKESKNRFFGRFLWGVDMLRENIEHGRQRELELQKEKKTLLLSLSHDIKTPLSAIKLYSKALSKGLYSDVKKQQEISESINSKADEIEKYVSEIIGASREDFLNIEISMSEFYLSEVIKKVSDYYSEKLSLIGTDFSVHEFSDCLLKGDPDRSVEVIQNILENAIKYGDGRSIEISFSEEDNCRLVTVKNSGCTLPENELPHIFESFWRGSNIGSSGGNGLGLYICRQIMNKMGGEVFSEIRDGSMLVTAVFVRA